LIAANQLSHAAILFRLLEIQAAKGFSPDRTTPSFILVMTLIAHGPSPATAMPIHNTMSNQSLV
jgi:hypothetical protein